jgi:hypothetical protein
MFGVYRVAVQYPNCAVKTTLLHSWQSATDSYARTLSEFSKGIGTGMSQTDYERLHYAMQSARESSKKAREDFQAHIDQHQCARAAKA